MWDFNSQIKLSSAFAGRFLTTGPPMEVLVHLLTELTLLSLCMTSFVFCYCFWSKIYFVWYKQSYSCSRLVCLGIFLSCLHFKLWCVLKLNELPGIWPTLSPSPTLYIFIGELNPFTFRVIVDRLETYCHLINFFWMCYTFLVLLHILLPSL